MLKYYISEEAEEDVAYHKICLDQTLCNSKLVNVGSYTSQNKFAITTAGLFQISRQPFVPNLLLTKIRQCCSNQIQESLDWEIIHCYPAMTQGLGNAM